MYRAYGIKEQIDNEMKKSEHSLREIGILLNIPTYM